LAFTFNLYAATRRELVDPFTETVLELMRGGLRRRGVSMSCILSFRDRSAKKSAEEDGEEGVASQPQPEGVFIGVKDIVASFVGRGCGCRLRHKCLSTEDEGYHVSVFEITPPPPP
jgi:hypothetical protein